MLPVMMMELEKALHSTAGHIDHFAAGMIFIFIFHGRCQLNNEQYRITDVFAYICVSER